MGKNYYLKWMAFLMLVVTVLASCNNDKMDDYYKNKRPLNGSAWELLEKEGNYTIFLKGIELAGYAPLVKGKGIFTIMAPDNNVLTEYLQGKSYGSIEEMASNNPAEFESFIGYHLVRYSYNREMFANYWPQAPLDPGVISVNEGLFHRFRTYSRDAVEPFVDGITAAGEKVSGSFFREQKLLPVYSNYLFKTNNLTGQAGSNYTFLYKDSEWNNGVELNEFNIANASVSEYAIEADNGYIYKISSVLDVPVTLDKFLTSSEGANYSMVKQAYDRFKVVTFDQTATTEYGKGTDLYLETHLGGLPNIAFEWPTDDDSQFMVMSYSQIVLFAPNNAALSQFYQDFWQAGGYSSFEEVDIYAIRALLNYGVSAGTLILPDNIEDLVAPDGNDLTETLGLTKSDIDNTYVANNGVLYGVTEVVTPKRFKNFTSPVYQYKDFSYFMQLMEVMPASTRDLLGFMDDAVLFIPPNDMLIRGAIGSSEIGFLENNIPFGVFGGTGLFKMNDKGEWVSISGSDAQSFIGPHIGVIKMIETSDEIIYKTLNSDYIYINTVDETVIGSYDFNEELSAKAYVKLQDFADGTAYQLEDDLVSAPIATETRTLRGDMFKLNNTNPPQSYLREFAKLLLKTEVYETNPQFDYMFEEKIMVIIPDDASIAAGIASGDIPPLFDVTSDSDDAIREKKAALNEYMKRYFVSIPRSVPLSINYPFPGNAIEGDLITYANIGNQELGFYSLKLYDMGTHLEIEDPTGNRLKVEEVFPHVFKDGVIYKIDGLIDLP